MLRVLEVSWLIIALLGGTFGGYKWVTECFSSSIGFFIFTIVAVIFWMVRRKQRIQMEKNGVEK